MAIEKIGWNKLPGGMRNLYTRAQDVINKKNYDYGVTLLKELIQMVPGFKEGRELLRAAEIQRTNLLAGFQKFTATFQAQLAIMKVKSNLKKNPREALNYAEDALALIYNEATLQAFHDAALAMETIELATDALDRILRLNPENESVIRQYLKDIEGVPGYAVKTLQLRQKIVELHPKDLKAQAELRAATASATMEMNAKKAEEEAEKEKASASAAMRDNGTNAPDLSDLERGDRIIRSVDDIKEMITRYEQVVAAGKGSVDVLRKLAEFYQKADMHEKAIETFQTLAEKQGTKDITVGKAIEKSQVALFNAQIEQMKAEGHSEEELADARKQVVQYQIDTSLQRIKDFPGDLQTRYELGLVYFEADMFEESIPEFKAASKNPQRKAQAGTYVGRALTSLQRYDEAVTLFKKLLGEMAYMDTQKMRTIYYLGQCYEQCGNREEAAYCYREIAKHNSSYQDVAEKVKQFEDIPAKVEEEDTKNSKTEESEGI